MTAASVWAGGPPYKYAHLELFSLLYSLGMVIAESPVNLVMKAYLPARIIIVSGELHPVHPHIGTEDTRALPDPGSRPGEGG